MGKGVRLYLVCDKTFETLEGADPLERHCGTCDRAVINFDPLADTVRERLMTLSAQAGLGLCVAGTASADDPSAIAPCRSPKESVAPPLLLPLAGAAMPPREAAKMAKRLARERQLEQREARALEQKQARARRRIEALLDEQRARLRGEPAPGFFVRLRELFR